MPVLQVFISFLKEIAHLGICWFVAKLKAGVLKQPKKDWFYDALDPGKTQQKSALRGVMG